MKICLVAEGSYPYITGGVSSWIHSLIRNLPEHRFVILAIAAERKQQGKFKYELPSNVEAVQEIFLDDYLRMEGEWKRRSVLGAAERDALKKFLTGSSALDWGLLFDLFRHEKFEQATDLLMSRDFFDILNEICHQKYEHIPFTEMFWTVRSMILPLLLTMRESVPEADLYHSVSTGYAGIFAGLGKHLYGKPMILTEHGVYSREREEEIIKADWVKGYMKDIWIEYFYTLSAGAYHYADRVITLFERNKEIQIELGCPEDKIRIIPNGVPYAEFEELPAKPAGEPLWVGGFVRVVPIKDIKTMLLSFQAVSHELPDAKFFIMGPYEEAPDYYEECLALTESLKLNNVVFTGNVNVKEYIGKMDVLVLTSISEGQPLAVLEGMAAGKPFVATDVGSCKELLYGVRDDFGKAGFVVPVMNHEEIGKAIVTLGRSAKLRKEMGQNGLNRIRRHYTSEAFIYSYRSLYQASKEAK